MGYFVIGVSGVTCGGKTTLTKLLLRKFPWARVVHQDHYFYEDHQLDHLRVAESENHVNYEVLEALDMEKMYKDVQAILEAPPTFTKPVLKAETTAPGEGDKAETPNFDDTFFQQIPDISHDVSKYKNVPILLIEGFTVFASEYLYRTCDVRFFCSLERATCMQRRSQRKYFPADSPNYFDKVIWPEYEKHYNEYVCRRPGITIFDGNTTIVDLWRTSMEVITCRIEEKNSKGGVNNSSTIVTL